MLIQKIKSENSCDSIEIEVQESAICNSCDKRMLQNDDGASQFYAGVALGQEATRLGKSVFFVEERDYSYWFIADTFQEVLDRIDKKKNSPVEVQQELPF